MNRVNKFRAWDGERMIYQSINKEFDDYYMLTLQGEFYGHTRTGDEYFDFYMDVLNNKQYVLMMESDFEISSYSDDWESGEPKFIYDGDIVKFHRFTQELGDNLGVKEGEIEHIGKISLQQYGWYFECDSEDNSGYLLHFYGIHEESFTRLGNIYENPELLTPTT